MGNNQSNSLNSKPSSFSNQSSLNSSSTNQPSFISPKIVLEDSINEEAQNFESKSQLKIDLESLLSCTLNSKQSYIKLSSSISQKLPVLINIKTKEIQNLEKQNKTFDDYRPPIDLFCVIDHSGSMAGTKIELVRETLKYLVSILSSNDRLCLIIFDDKAQTLSGLQRVTEEKIPMFNEVISKINHRGGTNMHLGLVKALEIMKARKQKNKVTSLFMLSDGLDNIGQVDTKFQKSLETLQINDVFTMNTFGFGNDHDPELMSKLATTKDGNFYYIEKLDLVDEFFVNALGGLLSVIGENFTLKLSTNNKPPFSDLRVSKTYGSQWKFDENVKQYNFHMNQLWLGITKELIVELNIPPIKKKVGDLERNVVLLNATIEVKSINENKSIKKEFELGFTLYNEDEEIPGEVKQVNQEVVMNYLRVQGAEVIQDARKLADEGKFEEGRKMIQTSLMDLQSKEYISDQKLQILAKDLQDIEKLCEPKQYEEKGKKFMMQQEMFHVEQRCNNVSMAYESAYCNSKQQKMLGDLRSKKK